MDYRAAWTYLDGLQFFKIKLGLDSMQDLLAELGVPHRDLRFVHIGGTNGKGSVGALLLEILSRLGLRVGLYTSPHLSSVRERFRINGRCMDEAAFARLVGRIRGVLAGREITYFECTTALALLWFAEQGVDCAIMEVGMGGRLDATNVISPVCCAITNVARDHEEYLGTTIRAIAGEKAGIVKPGVPVVTAAAGEALEVIRARCQELGAPLYRLGRDFLLSLDSDALNSDTLNSDAAGGGASDAAWRYRGFGPLASGIAGPRIGLAGRHQAANTGLALALLELLASRLDIALDPGRIAAAVAAARWPGRMEGFYAIPPRGGPRRRFLLDGAHNPAGAAVLAEHLAAIRPRDGRIVLLWGAMADKDLEGTLPVVARQADLLVLAGMEYDRAADPGDLASLVSGLGVVVQTAATVEEGLALAAAAAGERDVVCIAGSLYLVGAARRLLAGGDPCPSGRGRRERTRQG